MTSRPPSLRPVARQRRARSSALVERLARLSDDRTALVGPHVGLDGRAEGRAALRAGAARLGHGDPATARRSRAVAAGAAGALRRRPAGRSSGRCSPGRSPVVLDEHPDLAAATGALGRDAPLSRGGPDAAAPLAADRRATVDGAARRTTRCSLGGAAAPSQLLDGRARRRRPRRHDVRDERDLRRLRLRRGGRSTASRSRSTPDGRIRIGGPVLFDGYAGRPDLTAEVLRDGWLHHTRPRAARRRRTLGVLGRADDVVVSGGVNVSLAAVEAPSAAMPGVDQRPSSARPTRSGAAGSSRSS